MNPEPTRDPDDPLSSLLAEWQVDAAVPDRFQEGVWRRLAVSQPAADWGRVWHSTVLFWEDLVRRPVGIAACLAVFTAAGLAMGLWHAETLAHRAEAAWQNAYVQSVSPTLASLDP